MNNIYRFCPDHALTIYKYIEYYILLNKCLSKVLFFLIKTII